MSATNREETNASSGDSHKDPFSFFKQRPTFGDFLGGTSVALILIPQAIAYADIAGLPPTSGLICATLPLIIAAAFVSCPWLQTGPTAMTGLFTFGALAIVLPSLDDPADAIKVSSMLALIVGITRFTMGLANFGRFIRFLKEPVILGFTAAAAILIIASQLEQLVGIESDEKNIMKQAWSAITCPGSWSLKAIVMSVFCGAIILQCRQFHRLFPGIMLASVAAIFTSYQTGYAEPVVGEIASAWPQISLDFPWEHLPKILFTGIMIAIVGFAEPASISLALTREAGITWNASRELVASGVANFTAALTGGYPIGGSFSRTMVNQVAGSKTSWSSLITGVVVLGFTPFIGVLSYLPRAALATIIFLAVIRLIKVRKIRELIVEQPIWGFVSISTLIATLVSAPNIEYGILTGIVLSIVVGYFKKP